MKLTPVKKEGKTMPECRDNPAMFDVSECAPCIYCKACFNKFLAAEKHAAVTEARQKSNAGRALVIGDFIAYAIAQTNDFSDTDFERAVSYLLDQKPDQSKASVIRKSLNSIGSYKGPIDKYRLASAETDAGKAYRQRISDVLRTPETDVRVLIASVRQAIKDKAKKAGKK